jgi:hypothetical protein
MSEQVLKDKKGLTIGRITTDYRGVLIIKDPKGNTKGYYDPKTNVTKNFKGITVGSGNLLVSLL